MNAGARTAGNLNDTGYGVTIGTYEQALAMVGTRSAPRVGTLAVSEAAIQLFCATTEDGNPSYWDPEFAAERWGGIIAPPALLMTWVSTLFWTPGRARGEDKRVLPLSLRVPLPGRDIINSRQSAEIIRPARVGDRLAAHEWLEAISEEKRTHLGMGHFVTTMFDVKTPSGETIATVRNTALRYNRWPIVKEP